MKRISLILLVALTLCACNKHSQEQRPQWVQELETKNPLKDSANYTSVYFRFDTIINNYEVSGILYPFEEGSSFGYEENGVRLFFRSQTTDKEYIWTDWDEECGCFKWLFMSKNVANITADNNFKGFKSGDWYTFEYDTTPYKWDSLMMGEPNNPLLPYAEYQFYDVDFDGEQELLLGYYHGGAYGSPCYVIYETTDTTLVEKQPIGDSTFYSIDASTIFDSDNKTIINRYNSGCCEWGEYLYQADEKGDLHFIYHVGSYWDKDKEEVISDTTYIL